MAITQVRAQINGTWYTLTATGTAGQYTAQITGAGRDVLQPARRLLQRDRRGDEHGGHDRLCRCVDAGRAEVLRRGTRRAGHHDPVAVRRRLCFQ